uniref:Uncharacterized protein n=1 Tax=Anguilla anguilla TaxID=7936 RepID=A0A0E9QUQ4_ANGAN
MSQRVGGYLMSWLKFPI